VSVFDDPASYPALKLRQPYAGAVLLSALGFQGKDIETRDKRPRREGAPQSFRFVVCASLKDHDEARAVAEQLVPSRVSRDAYEACCLRPRMCALALATIKTVRPLEESDKPRSLYWKKGARLWAWELVDLAPLRPFALGWGAQGFFKVGRRNVDAHVLPNATAGEREGAMEVYLSCTVEGRLS
jgi:hypothetical protein